MNSPHASEKLVSYPHPRPVEGLSLALFMDKTLGIGSKTTPEQLGVDSVDAPEIAAAAHADMKSDADWQKFKNHQD